jgi:hypothetical protein
MEIKVQEDLMWQEAKRGEIIIICNGVKNIYL